MYIYPPSISSPSHLFLLIHFYNASYVALPPSVEICYFAGVKRCVFVFVLLQSELRECVYQLSSDVLHREKETFQMYTITHTHTHTHTHSKGISRRSSCYCPVCLSRYAGHYESLVRSLYSQLYQRDRQMDMWRKRAESVARDNHTTALVTAGELTHSSLLGNKQNILSNFFPDFSVFSLSLRADRSKSEGKRVGESASDSGK